MFYSIHIPLDQELSVAYNEPAPLKTEVIKITMGYFEGFDDPFTNRKSPTVVSYRCECGIECQRQLDETLNLCGLGYSSRCWRLMEAFFKVGKLILGGTHDTK